VDLGAQFVIQRVTLMPRQGVDEASARMNLEVQASNDPDFKDYVVLCERGSVPWYNKPGGRRVTNMWEQYLPRLPASRYLRVRGTVPGGALSLADFAAYGYPLSARKQ
jgi:hypothetical protein